MIKLNSLVIKSTREIPAPAWPPSGSWTMCARLYVNTPEDHICMNTVSWYFDGGSSYTYSDPDCNNYLDNLSQWNDGTEDTYLPISGQDSNGKYVNIFTNGDGGSVGNPWDFCVILANGRVNPISDDSWAITKVDVIASNSSTYYSYDNPNSPYQGQWLRNNDVSNWTQHQVSGGGSIVSTKFRPITHNITSGSGPAKAYSKFKIEMLGTVRETGNPGRYCQWCKVGLGWNGNNPVYGSSYYTVESYNLVNGTYFATWSTYNYPPSNLFIDDLRYKIDWLYNEGHKDDCYLEVIFTTNESINPTSIGLIAADNANSYPQRPEYFKLYGWDNGWDLITVVYGEDTTSGSNAESIFNISSTSSSSYTTIIRPIMILENIPDPPPPAQGYRYFLWYVEEDNDSLYHQQDFALSTDGTDKITEFTCLAGQTSSNPSTENYPNGFDGDSNTKWYSSGTYPNWAIFTNNTTINPIGFWYMTPGDQGMVPERAPSKYKLCGSNTLTTNPSDSSWVTLIDTTSNGDDTFRNVSDSYTWVYKSLQAQPQLSTVLMPDGNYWTDTNLAIDDGLGGITVVNSNTYTSDYGLNQMGDQYFYTYDAAVRVAASISGFHLPSQAEMYGLISSCYSEHPDDFTYALRTSYNWYDSNGTDLYGFKLFGTGGYTQSSIFLGAGDNAYLWTSNANGVVADIDRNSPDSILMQGATLGFGPKYSVRLIKD